MNIFGSQNMLEFEKKYDAPLLAYLAVSALLKEIDLTPKPALVDQRGFSTHTELTLSLMKRSAWALIPVFTAMSIASMGHVPDQVLLEHLADIGRAGEKAMLEVTGGVNTHRGTIWALGLLVSGASISGPSASARRIAAIAGEIARYKDRFSPVSESQDRSIQERYDVAGARCEAQHDFSTVIEWGLPTLWAARQHGAIEFEARLDALMALMSRLDDTSILYRCGAEALHAAQEGAAAVLQAGGTNIDTGKALLAELEKTLLHYHASPGGCGDMLAATLFLDVLTTSSTIWKDETRTWKK